MRAMGLTMAMMAAAMASAGGAQSADPVPPTVGIAGPVLMVTDLERSVRFYVEGLGLAVGRRLPGGPGPGATIVAPSTTAPFLLLRQQAATAGKRVTIRQGDGLRRIMLVAADSAKVAARLDRAGYAHAAVDAAHVLMVSDPDGYRFEVVQGNLRH